MYFLTQTEFDALSEEQKQTKDHIQKHRIIEDFRSKKVFERKGQMYMKEPHEEKFVVRIFVLIETYLYYYKTEKTVEEQYWIISLENAQIRQIKSEKKYCFELESKGRVYYLAPKTSGDLENWMRIINSAIVKATGA